MTYPNRDISMMFKKFVLLVIVVVSALSAKAQTADEVYNSYLDFNLARAEGRSNDAIQLGEQIIPNLDKMSDKAKASFYYSMGNLYENDSQTVKALPFYEKLVAAVPDYYVGQRALAYMYGKKVDDLSKKLNASAPNGAEYKRLYGLYIAQVHKTLPHLEKAQACDPSPETLELIKNYYKYLKDDKGLSTLPARLKDLSKNCIDLLTDK